MADAQPQHRPPQFRPADHLDAVDEFFVDAQDEGHGAAGDAGDDVGAAHGKALQAEDTVVAGGALEDRLHLIGWLIECCFHAVLSPLLGKWEPAFT
ncbi:MAG: hypothetical protein R2854_07310 [Caldilineaceae bacterium]